MRREHEKKTTDLNVEMSNMQRRLTDIRCELHELRHCFTPLMRCLEAIGKRLEDLPVWCDRCGVILNPHEAVHADQKRLCRMCAGSPEHDRRGRAKSAPAA